MEETLFFTEVFVVNQRRYDGNLAAQYSQLFRTTVQKAVWRAEECVTARYHELCRTKHPDKVRLDHP